MAALLNAFAHNLKHSTQTRPFTKKKGGIEGTEIFNRFFSPFLFYRKKFAANFCSGVLCKSGRLGGSRKRIIGGWRARTRYLWIIEIRQRNFPPFFLEADAFSRRQIKLNSVTIYELTDRDVATQPVQYQYRYSISIKMTEYAIDERRKLLLMNLGRLSRKTGILFAICYQIIAGRRFISQGNIIK